MSISELFKWLKSLGTGPKQLDRRDEIYRELAEASNDIICRVGRDLRARYISPASIEILDLTPEEIMALPLDRIFHPDDLPAIEDINNQLFSGKTKSSRALMRMFKKDGSIVWMEGVATRAQNRMTGEQGDTIVVLRDVTEQKKLEDQLAVFAFTDGLTGLVNRRGFDDVLDRIWQQTLANGTQMSLLLLDIDQFKKFNDSFGHQVGDDCLRAVSSAVKSAAERPDCVVARYGGEEIALVCGDLDPDSVIKLAEKVRATVAALRMPHPENIQGGGVVTVSIGAATALARAGGTMTMPAGLLQAADTALYKAKNNGRNRVETALLLATNEGGRGAD